MPDKRSAFPTILAARILHLQGMVVIVETPKGSNQKFKFDQKSQQFLVNKVLPEGMHFPFNFGFVPQTQGDDGDPLDVIILSEVAYPTSTALNCRIIGCLPARQTNDGKTIRNDRFVAVPDHQSLEISSMEQLPEETISEIQSFFIRYLANEGKRISFLAPLPSGDADSLLQLAKSSLG